MSEPENFLTRWSRRKLDAEEQAAPAAAEIAPQEPAEDAEGAAGVESRSVPDSTAVQAPAFDPASLPSLDSIGAETDISAFLKAGVPGDLRLAALRRAWVADPAIRDFKGLAENDWDFTIPNETMGFGEIDPGLDMKKMLADVFGDTPRVEPAAAELPPATEQPTPAPRELSAPANRIALNSSEVPSHDENIATDEEIVHRTNDAAPHADDDDGQDISPNKQKRRQGGALPQ
ncbi:MAG: DUF3306 domain-containing protein [Pseudolabrys sp.]|nr:DUF3306 domain-containing protein [Pseudolabrys sp.]MDP2297096.1 DUF3306 domain-containing protein [Pseudolabrys sp.]